jgi:alpha-mannosidase
VRILEAESTDLFVGTEAQPLQVVRVRLGGAGQATRRAAVTVQGAGLTTERPGSVERVEPGGEAHVEVGVAFRRGAQPGDVLAAEAVVDADGATDRRPLVLTVEEPGWRLFMVSHFHYDPVWWNTQAAYTETWGTDRRFRSLRQEPGLALVKAHLEIARRDADYKFVLAELDYLKPYWDAFPEDRNYIRQLLSDGRLELMGGTYNEPNTNLTSAETTIRNAIYGVGYQRDVLGGNPQTAWQLDAFGHDPQFPGIMAEAGVSSSSWARGPFHEWGPHWFRGPGAAPPMWMQVAEPPGMQFTSEFDWIAPSGRSLLTSFMPDHYSAGWWMDAAISLEQAESEVHRLFRDLRPEATTKNVLLPVGTDYTPPNRWVTAIHRDWNRRYVWPKFVTAIARDFFDAVRAERRAIGRGFSPQTRDMNPIYTGKDVSFIDTKQAQRVAENVLMSAEKFATIASLFGARYPSEATDKAWRQLLFGAHHDGITGSESDQVYLDLLGGWREAHELGADVLDRSLASLGARIDTNGDGRAVTVFNPLSWSRTDVCRVEIDVPDGRGIELRDERGRAVPVLVEATEPGDTAGGTAGGTDGTARVALRFIAHDVPALGYRTYRAVPNDGFAADGGWRAADGTRIENDAFSIDVDPQRGGAIVRLVERASGRDLLRKGEVGNELRCYREYPMHPLFGEGPWHLTPDGTRWSSVDEPAEVTVERSAIGQRIRVTGPFQGCRRTQEIVLWDGIERVDFATRLDDYSGQDLLFRIRFGAAIEGGMPISEVGNAVIGRGFGFPNEDVGTARYTLDNPAYNWFALGTTARVDLLASPGKRSASRAFSIAEIVTPDAREYDDGVRAVVLALVRAGVTATVGSDTGRRYGTLDVDSNLPDVRVSVGGPADNTFTAALLDAAGGDYASELERQLKERGWARLWVPAARPLVETWRPDADLRGVRELPVLVVAGRDFSATAKALHALADDLGDAIVDVEQPAKLNETTGRVDDFTIGLLNRGNPGFNVEPDGSMYLSLMRSCSGWPSGVWINPPRRTMPDGSNFQFQHWSHTFDYALVAGAGDWRARGIVRGGHEFNNPLTARVLDAHGGPLPATTSFVSVEPTSAVATVLKPAGEPLSRMADPAMDPAAGIALRIYESSGRPTQASVRFFRPLSDTALTNALEEDRRPIRASGDRVAIDLEPFSIATLHARPEAVARADGGDGRAARARESLGPRAELAQPVYADYWLHNKGPAPIGYQPLAVQIRPSILDGPGPFTLPVTVASERTDRPVAGSVSMIVPEGWTADPPERIYRLAPGAHLALDVTVTTPNGAPAGRYFVAARIADEDGQVHEDVVTIDYQPDGNRSHADRDVRLPILSRSIERAIAPAAGETVDTAESEGGPELGGELEAELLDRDVAVDAGRRAEIRVVLRNGVASEIRGEAQLISPHETWPAIRPWTQGFTVAPGAAKTVTFGVEPPLGFAGGTYWALVKLMYFGRLIYTEAISVSLRGQRAPTPARATVAGRAG